MDERVFSMAASCAKGMEILVAREIESFGGKDPVTAHGLVSWNGRLASGYRSCLWSRYASRVFLELESFAIADASDLYERGRGIAWHDHLEIDSTFAIDCTLSGTPVITHSHFAALRLKDAIADSFREHFGERPSVDSVSPSLRLHLHLNGNQVTISLDLSGESLHRRGYRVSGGPAPLKETLAAALVAFSGWHELSPQVTLIDPMCGTGTLLIEAALLFGDVAPGLSRRSFGFMGWKRHDATLWQVLVEEAIALEEAGILRKWPLLIGYDADPVMVAAAKKNIEKAGLSEQITIRQKEIANLQPSGDCGMLLSNLPFGERLSEGEEVSALYRACGRITRERFPGWRVAFFLSNPERTDSFGISWDRKLRLFNGDIACRLLVGTATAVAGDDFCWTLAESTAEDDEFVNRLRKTMKKMLKWATKEGIHCFRVYDRDLPEFNISIDLYEKWVHVQEYAAPASVDPELARLRLEHALRGVRELFGIRRDRIFIKTRRRQRGNEQYQRKEGKHRMIEVREGGCRFLVNLAGYLDTGLFLDHRPVRMRIAREAAGKRFLNLFGYSGTATVHAAMAGAVATTTVDLSANYLQWTRLNLALNGFAGFAHRTVRADCLDWLEHDQGSYDLIFVDPPTFSNTKKEKRVFEIQRDHHRLLTLAMARLATGGLLIFSTNFKKFRIDTELARKFVVSEISEKTIPFDFQRNGRVHHCFEIQR